MKVIHIKAEPFFEHLKLRDTSMWDLFVQMIDGEEKHLIFTDEQEKVVAEYVLPKTVEKLEEDKEAFNREFAAKLNRN